MWYRRAAARTLVIAHKPGHRHASYRGPMQIDLDRLAALVAIPSVSGSTVHAPAVRKAAEAVLAWAADAGLPGGVVLQAPAAGPAAFALREGDPGAPVVLLYAHHDVVPAGAEADWSSPPFRAQQRDGRLYGRGTADDKAAIAVHMAAVETLSAAGGPQPTLMLFSEGEEELGSPHALGLLESAPGFRAPDVVLVPDADAWSVDEPYLTTAMRAGAEVELTVRTLAGPVHSGMFGGAVPDAMHCLVALLASCFDVDGRLAIAGIDAMPTPDDWRPPDVAGVLADAGALPGVRAYGADALAARVGASPWLSVIGLDLPRPEEAEGALAAAVRAKLDLRFSPTQDPQEAVVALAAHFERVRPWGSSVALETTYTEAGYLMAQDDPVAQLADAALAEAWGASTRRVGAGANTPIVGMLAARFPAAAFVVTATADARCNAHGVDESVALSLVERLARAEALMLERLARAC